MIDPNAIAAVAPGKCGDATTNERAVRLTVAHTRHYAHRRRQHVHAAPRHSSGRAKIDPLMGVIGERPAHRVLRGLARIDIDIILHRARRIERTIDRDLKFLSERARRWDSGEQGQG